VIGILTHSDSELSGST